jgi:two-component system, NarL family, response regulator NreC
VNNDITIVAADDHEIYRDGLQLLSSTLKGIKLIGMAENGQELISLVQQLKPDVVLTDIKMPVKDGIEATRIITASFPEIGVIGLTMFEEEQQIIDMLEAGAMGYLVKNASKEEVQEAIMRVHNRQNYYCNQTTKKITWMIAKSRYNPYKRPAKIIFSEKELEVIKLICDGLTNKEIANSIKLSYRTVEGYRTRIQEKMDVHNTASIIIYAIKNQLIDIH